MDFIERIEAERKALRQEMTSKTDEELNSLYENDALKEENFSLWNAAKSEIIARAIRKEKMEKELEAIKTFKDKTSDELRTWLLNLEMSNSYSKYEITIKAIRAELAKREKLKEAKKLNRKAATVENLAIIARRTDSDEIKALLKTATKAMLNEMFFAMTGTKLCAEEWILRKTLKKHLIEAFIGAFTIEKAA